MRISSCTINLLLSLALCDAMASPYEPTRPSPLGQYSPIPVADLGSITFKGNALDPNYTQTSTSPWQRGEQTVTYQGQDIPSSISYAAQDAAGPGYQATTFNFDPGTGTYVPSAQRGFANTPSAGWNAFAALTDVAAAAPGVINAVGSLASGSALPDVFSTPTLDPSVFSAGASGAAEAAGAASALPDVFNTPTLDPSVFAQGAPGAAEAAGALPDVFSTPTLDPSLFAPGSSLGADPIMLASLGGNASDVAGVSGLGDLGGGLSILPATGMSDVASLDPGLADTLGIAGDTGAVDLSSLQDVPWPPPSVDAEAFTPAALPAPAQVDPTMGGLNIDAGNIFQQAGAAAGNFGKSALNWMGAHPASTALTGLSLLNSLKRPALPPAAAQASGAASASLPQQQQIVSSGGTAAPQWTQQKSAIDAQVDQQVKQLTEQLMQAQINSGAGGGDSAVTQQKIAQLKSTLETQRQQLYMAAQAQNVAQAIQLMSGNNATLMATAQMQLQQSQEAQAAAMQTAELALLLASGAAPSLKLG
jgi:hypothetical protein